MRHIYFILLVVFFLIPQIANACEPNLSSSSILTREKWTEIKKVMKNTSMTLNREPVSKSQIISIVGFLGKCDSSSSGRIESCIWLDQRDCKKKIKAKFRDDELVIIRQSGF